MTNRPSPTTNLTKKCRHFTGIHHSHCRDGIKYDSVWATFSVLPCIFPEHSHECARFKPYTKQEAIEIKEENSRSVREAIKNRVDLQQRKSTTCYECGEEIEYMERVRDYVYAKPCGCRLWLGIVPKTWWKPSMVNGNVKCACCGETFTVPDPDGQAAILCPNCGRIT